MPRLPPPVHTRFKKGQSGNPGGKPKNLYTADDLKRSISIHFMMRKEQIDDVLADAQSKAIDLMICSAISRCIKEGDMARAEYMFVRLLGRVKDVLEVTRPEPVIIKRANGETVALDTKEEEENASI